MAYYTTEPIETIDELRPLFPDKTDYTMNWLFLSTSGVHGSYATLSDREAEDEWPASITVLAVQPRTVRSRYGTIPITKEDVPWLRDRVTKTLAGIAESQAGNIIPSPAPQ